MDTDWSSLVGGLVVRDQEHLVRLAIESSMGVFTKFHVIDNMSDDTTPNVIRATADEHDLDLVLERRDGYAGRLFLDILEQHRGEYVFRMEGDQCYFPNRLEQLVELAKPGYNTAASVTMLRNYAHLQNRVHPINAPHPTIYYCDGTNAMVDGKLWPRSDEHDRLHDEDLRPIGCNLKVLSPTEMIKRWHRAAWWRWGDRDVEAHLELEDYAMPYAEHLTLEEYIFELRARGKGTATTEWGRHVDAPEGSAELLEELGRAYIAWDVRHNCNFYGGPYPDRLRAAIDDKGYGLGVV